MFLSCHRVKCPRTPVLIRTILFGAALLSVSFPGHAQNTITDFVSCLNTKLVVAANLKSNDVNNVNISDTVQCLPQGCMVIDNLSAMSAQKAGSILTLACSCLT